MSKNIVAIVKQLNGKYIAIDEEGNVRVLKKGDVIYENEEVRYDGEQPNKSLIDEALNFDDIISSDTPYLLILHIKSDTTHLISYTEYIYFDSDISGSDNGTSTTTISNNRLANFNEDASAGTSQRGGNIIEQLTLTSSQSEAAIGQNNQENLIQTILDVVNEKLEAPSSEQPTQDSTPIQDSQDNNNNPIEPINPTDSIEPNNPTEPTDPTEPTPNTPPTIDSGDFSGSVKEIKDLDENENSTTLTTNGKVQFSDENQSDTHTIQSTNPQGSNYKGDFVARVENGEIVWDFSVNDADLDTLKEGETLTQIYTITLDDGNGGTITQDISVVINGTNDAPTLEADTYSITKTSPNANGNVLDNDTDIDSDTLSVTAVNGQSLSSQIPTTYGIITMNEDGTYTYTADTQNPYVQNLFSGETLSDIITYTADDGNGGTKTQTLTITINGEGSPNNIPVISGTETSGNVTEITDLASGENFTTHAVSGTLSYSDGDLSDTHTILATPQSTDYLGVFTPSIDTATKEIKWDFNIEDSKIDNLKEGQVLTQIYTLTLNDGHGGTTTQDVTVTITGANDAPIAQADVGGVTISANPPATSGKLLANDSDVDSDTLNITNINYKTNDTPISSDTTITTTYGELKINPDGTYTYTADGTNPTVSTLGHSDTLTETFTYTVDDGNGGTDTQTLTITITGHNQVPVISIGTGDKTTDTITETANPATHNDSTNHIASGKLHYSDGDSTDTHTLSTTPNGSNYIGTFTPTLSGGLINWSFSVPDSALDKLQVNDTITQKYTITISDNGGGTDTQDVTITINGSKDNPDISLNTGDSTNATVTEIADLASGENATKHNKSGELSISDPDSGDTKTITYSSPSSYLGTFTANKNVAGDKIEWDFKVNDSDIDYLKPGESLTQTYTVTITDSTGLTDTQDVTITITGTNDKPIIDLNGSASGINYETTFTEDTPQKIVSNNLTISDDDHGNMKSATITLTDAKAGDSFDTSGIDTTLFNVTNSSGTVTITPISTATKAQFETAIKAITFNNPNENRDTTDRTINFVINDGTDNSVVATTTLHVVSTPDKPILDLDGSESGTGYETTFKEDTSGVSIVDSDMIISDADSTTMQSMTITLKNPQTGDSLDTSGVNSALFTVTINSGVITIAPKTGVTTTKADFASALKAIKFTNSSDTPNTTDRTIEIKVNDSSNDSNTATSTIHINPTPDAYSEAAKDVTENKDGSTTNNVSGNLITGGTNQANGLDDQGSGGASMHQITYNNPSGISTTATITTNNTSLITQYGKLVINTDGSYTYTPNANLTHPNSGNDLAETFTYTIKDSDGDTSNSATQTINIADGAAPIIPNATNSVDEENLPSGSSPNNSLLTKTGTFGVTKGTDDFSVTFDTTQTALEALGLKSSGTALQYTITGSTITATKGAGGDTVFTVTITNPTSTNAGYSFVLSNPLDHSTSATDLNLPFALHVTDDDDSDSDTSTLTITVVDDNVADNVPKEVDEDSSITFTTNADATGANTTISASPSHGTATVLSNGQIKYTPNADYSGTDTFTYATATDGGTTKTYTINMTVNPISDAPTLGGDVKVSVNEDETIAFSTDTDWQLPEIKDDGTSTGNNATSERMGLITIEDIPKGATLYDNTGTQIYVQPNTQNITIQISDDPSYHVTGLTGATLSITKAQFEGLQIKPPLNSSTDMDLTLKVTEYEVNSTGAIISGVAGVERTQDITVTVLPVTDGDNFALTAKPAPTGEEDKRINLKDYFTFTESADADGSENYTLEFSSTNSNALDHVWFKYKNGSWQRLDAFNDADHKFFTEGSGGTGGGLPNIYIKTDAHDSQDIEGLTLKLTVRDEDEDDGTPATSGTNTNSGSATLSQQATLGTITIVPVANDITLANANPEGNEDTLIDMELDFVKKDSQGMSSPTSNATNQEVVDHLIISNIPNGAKIYNGSTVVFTGDGINDFDTSTVGGGLSEAEIKALQILPPQDFSGKINLSVKVYSKDFDDDDPTSSIGEVTTNSPASKNYTITVNGVVDTSATDTTVSGQIEGVTEVGQNASDGTDGNHLYVKINNTLVNGSTTASTTFAHGTEDTPLNLNMSWKSYEHEQHSTPATDKSETAEFIITNQTPPAGVTVGYVEAFTIVDSGGNALGTKVSGGWKLTAEELAKAYIKAQKDYSGTLYLQLQTAVTDGTDKNTQTDKFEVTFNAVTDDPILQVTDVYAKEDTKTKFEIFPQTTDVDSSENVTQVLLSNIPAGVTLYTESGGTFTQIPITGTSHTLIIDDTASPVVGSITSEQLKNLYIQAPTDSNVDFTLDVQPTVQDGSATPVTPSATTVTVHVKGEADTPTTSSVTTITGDERQEGDNTGTVNISSLTSTSGESSSDGSETLYYVLHDLPSSFRPTDSSGNIIGSFISANGGLVTWSFTQAQMNELHIQAPTYYSGTTTLNLETIAVEDDGDTDAISKTFNLVINPVVSTTDPVVHGYDVNEPVETHPSNNPTGATTSTYVPLTFTNTKDSETITQVEISNVPNGVVLGTYISGTLTEFSPTGGTYTFTSNIDDIVAIIKNDGALTNSDGTITISDIKVTVQDSTIGTTTATQTLTVSPININIEGQADQPYITGASVEDPSSTGFHYNNITLTGNFPDSDSSEDHYYIVTTDESVLLNKGSYQGNGTWYLTSSEVSSGFHAWVNGSVTEDLTITAYSQENTLEHNSVTLSITGYTGNDGTDPTISAQTPTLVVTDPTPNEDATFTLADIVSNATKLNDTDSNNETISFVIKDLDLSTDNIKSIQGVSQFSYDDNGTTKTAYRIDIPATMPSSTAIQSALNSVVFTPAEDFSGQINFTLEAIANEPNASAGGGRIAVTSEAVTITVQPQAETSLIATPTVGQAIASAVNEDSITPIYITLSNKDSSNPESFSDLKLSLNPSQGTFVDSGGNSLGTSLTGLNYNSTTGEITTSDGTKVHYQPPENEGGNFTINVTADMTDGTNTTQDATTTINVEVTPLPDSGAFTLQDGAGNTVSTTDKLTVVEDHRVKLDIHYEFDDSDHSEFQTILIENVPEGMLFFNSLTSSSLVGEITSTTSSGNTWKLPASVANGNLYITPPLHYSDDITMTVVGIAMEQDNMGNDQTYSKEFTLEIDPVANGATILPENASGDEDEPIAINLHAQLVSNQQIASAGLTHTDNETYNITFKDVKGDEIELFTQNSGVYTKIDDTNTTDGDYTITGLTQAELDSLHVKVLGNETGTFQWNIEVTTTDGTSTSSATQGVVSLTVNPVLGDDNGDPTPTSGDDTIYGHSGNDTIDGLGGSDTIYAGSGDDTIVFDASDALADGGLGTDTLKVGAGTFSNIASIAQNIEIIDLSLGSTTINSLSVAQVAQMTDSSNTLKINGGNDDTINTTGWTENGTTVENGITYHVLDNSSNDTHLKIQDGVNYVVA